jgi:photosystem II stability/assembly factor-like uncharacterized protein
MPGWVDDLEFLDSRIGWIAASDCVRGKGIVAGTNDGGRHWRILTRRFSHSCNAGATLELSFVDRRHGWLVWFEPTGQFSELYRTRDGGATWRLTVPRHAPTSVEQMRFVTPDLGWGGGAGPAGGPGPLLRSEDGGRRWKPDRQLPVGHYAMPVFTGTKGVVGVAVRRKVALYATGDAGRHWVRAARLAFARSPSSVRVSSPTPGVWWVIVGFRKRQFLAVSGNAGRSWTRREVPRSLRWLDIVAMSSRRAWASSAGRLLVTDDAGRTWRNRTP